MCTVLLVLVLARRGKFGKHDARKFVVDWEPPPRLASKGGLMFLVGRRSFACLEHAMERLRVARRERTPGYVPGPTLFGFVRFDWHTLVVKSFQRDHPLSCIAIQTPWSPRLMRFLLFAGTFSLATAMSAAKLLGAKDTNLNRILKEIAEDGVTPSQLFVFIERFTLNLAQVLGAGGLAFGTMVVTKAFSKVTEKLVFKRPTLLQTGQPPEKIAAKLDKKAMAGGVIASIIYCLSVFFLWAIARSITKLGFMTYLASFICLVVMKLVVGPVIMAFVIGTLLWIASRYEVGIVDRIFVLMPEKMCFLHDDFPEDPQQMAAIVMRDFTPADDPYHGLMQEKGCWPHEGGIELTEASDGRIDSKATRGVA
jgi:hypothetical protein